MIASCKTLCSDSELIIQRRIKMNSNSLKKLLAVAMAGLFLISVGASAGETKASCEKNGGRWDDVTHKCKIRK